MLNIPNILSLLRLAAVPLNIWLILAGQMQLAFFLFVMAGITDALDGYIAKHYNMRTDLGAYLDPAADKTLLISIFLALGYLHLVPLWLVLVVVSRDILIVGAIIIARLMGPPVKMNPLFSSKLNTFAQILLAALVLANEGFSLGLAGTITFLALLTAGLTLFSAISYSRIWLKTFN